MPRQTQPIEVRFWAKVQKTNGCWLWTASKNSQGYGWIGAGGRGGAMLKAHRVAYELTYSRIPQGLLVCHHCDNPTCVRPAHLFLGSASDNIRDCLAKGRRVAVRRTHCARGHAFTPENTIADARWPNSRSCKTCRRSATATAKSPRPTVSSSGRGRQVEHSKSNH